MYTRSPMPGRSPLLRFYTLWRAQLRCPMLIFSYLSQSPYSYVRLSSVSRLYCNRVMTEPNEQRLGCMPSQPYQGRSRRIARYALTCSTVHWFPIPLVSQEWFSFLPTLFLHLLSLASHLHTLPSSPSPTMISRRNQAGSHRPPSEATHPRSAMHVFNAPLPYNQLPVG